MNIKNITLCILLLTSSVHAIEGLYVGGQVGHVGLTNGYGNAIGFGLDLGVRTNPVLDVMFQFQSSSHTGGLTQNPLFLSAQYHLPMINDFDFTLAAGPGVYLFKTAFDSQSNFGLHGGAGVDVTIEDRLRIGVDFKWHQLFSPTLGNSFWTVMMRFGFFFPFN